MMIKKRRLVSFFLLLSCVVCFCACSLNSKEVENPQLSNQFYENLLKAFNAKNYTLVRTGLDKINNAGIEDERTLYLEALLNLIQQHPETAIIKLQESLTHDPEFSEAHNTLGIIYMEQGNYELAKTEFLIAGQNPIYQTPEKAFHNLGNLYNKLGKKAQAIAYYKKAIQQNPDYFPSHYELSRIYLELNQLETANLEIEKAREISPEHPGVWLIIGNIYLAGNQIDDAIAAFNKVILLDPGSIFADQASQKLKLNNY